MTSNHNLGTSQNHFLVREYLEPPTSTCCRAEFNLTAEVSGANDRYSKQSDEWGKSESVTVLGRRPLRRINLSRGNCESPHSSTEQASPPARIPFVLEKVSLEKVSHDSKGSLFLNSHSPSPIPTVVRHTPVQQQSRIPLDVSSASTTSSDSPTAAAASVADRRTTPPRPPQRTTSLPTWSPSPPSTPPLPFTTGL
jgi:hypothetical protein